MTLLVVGALLVAFPLLWMISVSFMPTGAASTFPPPLLPAHPTLDNYRELFAKHAAGRYMLNSALIATIATLISLVFNTLAGYAFAKLRFRGRERIFRGLLGALVIPSQVAMIPLFALVKELGLVSTYGGVVVPAMASVFGIFLVRQYALSLPDELLEAARIDGASEARIFWSLVVPLVRPILVTLAILTFLGDLERFHVAVDRPDRREAAHAAGRTGRPVARARAGQRADDGRLGDHRRAGAAAVPRRCSGTTSRASLLAA